MTKVNLLADSDTLVSDERLGKVFNVLSRLVGARIPDGLGFRTQRQEPVENADGMGHTQPAMAVFIIQSPHPGAKKNRVIVPALLTSVATCPWDQWVEANKEYRHYANLTDPLRPIFAGLLREHLSHRENLEALQEN